MNAIASSERFDAYRRVVAAAFPFDVDSSPKMAAAPAQSKLAAFWNHPAGTGTLYRCLIWPSADGDALSTASHPWYL